jgi:hypothetical protein
MERIDICSILCNEISIMYRNIYLYSQYFIIYSANNYQRHQKSFRSTTKKANRIV